MHSSMEKGRIDLENNDFLKLVLFPQRTSNGAGGEAVVCLARRGAVHFFEGALPFGGVGHIEKKEENLCNQSPNQK